MLDLHACDVCTCSPHRTSPSRSSRSRHSHDSTLPKRSRRGRLGNEGGSGSRVVLERRGDLLLGLVVAREAVNARLDENEAELGVLVLAVGLEVLADGDGLLDKVPEILGDRGRETLYQPIRYHA